jgi:hypothetical protein
MKKIISWDDFVVEKTTKPKYSKEEIAAIKKKAKPLKKEEKKKDEPSC